MHGPKNVKLDDLSATIDSFSFNFVNVPTETILDMIATGSPLYESHRHSPSYNNADSLQNCTFFFYLLYEIVP
jgi:hypothetical protein